MPTLKDILKVEHASVKDNGDLQYRIGPFLSHYIFASKSLDKKFHNKDLTGDISLTAGNMKSAMEQLRILNKGLEVEDSQKWDKQKIEAYFRDSERYSPDDVAELKEIWKMKLTGPWPPPWCSPGKWWGKTNKENEDEQILFWNDRYFEFEILQLEIKDRKGVMLFKLLAPSGEEFIKLDKKKDPEPTGDELEDNEVEVNVFIELKRKINDEITTITITPPFA